jgi:hypothetical protein
MTIHVTLADGRIAVVHSYEKAWVLSTSMPVPVTSKVVS